MYVCMYVCVCVCICMYVCMHACMHACIYIIQILWSNHLNKRLHTTFFWTLSLSLSPSLHRHHTRLFSRRGRAFLFCHLPGCCIEPSACKCGRSGQWTAPKHILLTSWLNHLESGAFWNHLESSGINISVLPSGALAVNGQGVSARSAEDSVSRSHKKQLQGANVHPQSAWVGAYSVFNFILHLFSTCPTKKNVGPPPPPHSLFCTFAFPPLDLTTTLLPEPVIQLPLHFRDASMTRLQLDLFFLCHQKGWHRLSGVHGSCSLVSPLDGYIYIYNT